MPQAMEEREEFKILVVDDIESARHVVVRLLHNLGYVDIEEAKDGAEALKLLEENPYQLVISDWDMPNMTGLELLRHLRRNPSLHDLPFVLLTADAGKEKVLEAAKERVSQYLLKPFTQITLQAAIDSVLKKKNRKKSKEPHSEKKAGDTD